MSAFFLPDTVSETPEKLACQIAVLPSLNVSQLLDQDVEVDRLWSIEVELISECGLALFRRKWVIEGVHRHDDNPW